MAAEDRGLVDEFINAMRLSLNTWSSEGGKRPLPDYLAEAFAALDAVFRVEELRSPGR